MNRLEQYLAGKLNERTQAGNLRRLATHRAPIDLFSNDYLGLATTGALAKLMHPLPVNTTDTGSTGSRLLSGNAVETEDLERTIAAFQGAEAALVFNSGYDANVGLLSSITSRHTTLLYDELCHASLIDGIRLSQCRHKYRYAHNDIQELETLLQKYCTAGPVVVITESIFSMDGDVAPLEDIARLCEQYDAQLVVDEAHATGVTGNHGEGLVCSLGLQQSVFARIHTFGKALGCHGAAVVGSSMLREYLINFARTFIYTTALPPHSIRTAACAYQYLASNSFSNAGLHELIGYFRQRISQSGNGNWKDSNSPIQALITGSNAESKRLATLLQQAGLQVNPILHPTVPEGRERLRVCLHTFNTREEIDTLFNTIAS